jgi:hypothetical protein
VYGAIKDVASLEPPGVAFARLKIYDPAGEPRLGCRSRAIFAHSTTLPAVENRAYGAPPESSTRAHNPQSSSDTIQR